MPSYEQGRSLDAAVYSLSIRYQGPAVLSLHLSVTVYLLFHCQIFFFSIIIII